MCVYGVTRSGLNRFKSCCAPGIGFMFGAAFANAIACARLGVLISSTCTLGGLKRVVWYDTGKMELNEMP